MSYDEEEKDFKLDGADPEEPLEEDGVDSFKFDEETEDDDPEARYH